MDKSFWLFDYLKCTPVEGIQNSTTHLPGNLSNTSFLTPFNIRYKIFIFIVYRQFYRHIIYIYNSLYIYIYIYIYTLAYYIHTRAAYRNMSRIPIQSQQVMRGSCSYLPPLPVGPLESLEAGTAGGGFPPSSRSHFCLLPSGYVKNSYWKWPFIVDFPIKNGDFP